MDGSRMKELRLLAGLTQAELALDLGVRKTTVYRWEKGRSRIKRGIEGVLTTLVNDKERLSCIKNNRVRGRRSFSKKLVDKFPFEA